MALSGMSSAWSWTGSSRGCSFEAELVYTLNDLSSRLNSLAGVLNAYWGQGAA
jgi:hypothetical protein